MFRTLSGSQYILKIIDKKITLIRKPKNSISSLRNDNVEIEVISFFPIEEGKKALLLLEPLGEGNCTWRYTNVVSEIKEIIYM